MVVQTSSVDGGPEAVVLVRLVEHARSGHRELQNDDDVVLSASNLAGVRLLNTPKRRLGRLHKHAVVAQLVVQDLEHLLGLHGVAEELVGDADAADAQGVSHLEAHGLQSNRLVQVESFESCGVV